MPLQSGRRFRFGISSSDMEHDDPLDVEGAGPAPAAPGRTAEGIDLAALEQDVVHGDWSLNRIAAKHGTSRWFVENYARLGGWVRLVGTKSLSRGRLPGCRNRTGPQNTTPEQRRLAKMARRLFRVLDARLTEIEERMAKAEANGEASAAEAERDMRSLSALARVYAKLVELDEAARKSQAGKGSDTPTPPTPRSDDADHLRRDLALRLERLNQAPDG